MSISTQVSTTHISHVLHHAALEATAACDGLDEMS
jgi:hypothetical protein